MILCFSDDLDEYVHVPVPHKSHIIFAWDSDINNQIKCIFMYRELSQGIHAKDSVCLVCQSDCQVPKDDLDCSGTCDPCISTDNILSHQFKSVGRTTLVTAIHCQYVFTVAIKHKALTIKGSDMAFTIKAAC